MTAPALTDVFDPQNSGEAEVIIEALATGLTGRSQIVSRYERGLKAEFEVAHAVAVSSGFGALVVALSALGLKAGDKVLLTPTCPLCTAYALTFLRLEPVFCDIRPDDFSMDLDHAARRFDARTKAIIDIPMWGYPVPADGVAAFARDRGMPFILDLALAHRAKLHGRLLSSFADLATFSTHSSKNLVTGEGGAVLTDNDRFAASARRFSNPHRNDVEAPGLNYSLGGLQAALGVARLPRLKADVAQRVQTMKSITDRLDNRHLQALPIVEGGEPSGTKLIIRERSGSNRALLRHQSEAAIPSDIATYDCKPLYQYPVFAARAEACPNAEAMLSSITTIPVHPDIGPAAIERIVGMLNSYRPALDRKVAAHANH